MINVGFGNSVVAARILAVVNPKSSPMKKLKEEAKLNNKLIDVTEGRRTRSIIILDIDVQGCRQVRAAAPEAVSIFIVPPSWEELAKRLTGRGTDDAETITQRFVPFADPRNLEQKVGEAPLSL